jgi:multidrug resistance efflux pump
MIMLVIVAAVLLGLIFYSQMRTTADFVSGLTEADEIQLGSRVGGRIKKVLVQEGDFVHAGTPLVEFEPYDLLEREQQAAADLAARQAELDRLTAGLREEEIGQAKARWEQAQSKYELLKAGARPEEIAAAESRLQAAQAELVLAQRAYERIRLLAESKSVSKAELDTASQQFEVAQDIVSVRRNELAIVQSGPRQQELDQAQASAEEARLAWELAKKGFRDEEIKKAAAARDAAQAAWEVVIRQKSELVINAPSDGYVDALDLQAGDLVPANAPVMTLQVAGRLWVRAYVPQRFLRLQVGDKLRVSIDSLPDQDFSGTVSFVSHQAEFTPSNVQTSDERAKQVYRVRVTIGERAELLRAGMTANVWLDSTKATR